MAVKIDRHRPPPPRRARAPYLIYASDDTGDIVLTYFKARQDYLEKLLPVGTVRYVSGTAAIYDGMLQMVHPDRVVSEADLAKLPLVEPVYPLTEGLGLNQVRRAAESAVARIPVLPEWQDPSWLRARAVSRLRRGAAHPAPAGRADRRHAGGLGLVAAGL